VQKIVYQQINILDICQGLMKMAGSMEDEGLPHPKGETTSGIT
jgi:hypothetical protein